VGKGKKEGQEGSFWVLTEDYTTHEAQWSSKKEEIWSLVGLNRLVWVGGVEQSRKRGLITVGLS